MKKGIKIFFSLVVLMMSFIIASCGETETPVVTPTVDPTPTENVPTENVPTTDVPTTDVPTTEEPTQGTETPEVEMIDYVVECKSINGKPLKDVVVTFKLDGKTVFNDLTTENGTVTANLEKNIYTVSVIPTDGYIVQPFNNKTDLLGTKIEIECYPELIMDNTQVGHVYTQGDIMYDFTLTDPNGKEFNLSSLLEEKRAVILNFWYSDCYYCNEEFPFMQEAYASTYETETGEVRNYSDDIVILGINYGYDTNQEILNIKNSYGITFEMLLDNIIDDEPELTKAFNVTGFPTTVIIDSYGLVAEIEEGAITSAIKWKDCFDTYIDEDYTPEWNGSIDGEEPSAVKPNIAFPEAGVLENVALGTNSDGTKFETTFEPEDNEKDAEWTWPWIVSQDGQSIVPANQFIDSSFATIYFEVEMKVGQVFTFDYKSSTEEYDYLYVMVDRSLATYISGISNDWERCFAFVAEQDGTYEMAFCYLKDGSTSTGDDLVYIKNMRLVDVDDIDEPAYIFRECASGQLSIMTETYQYYANVVFNEEDGYYHVDTVDGPLLFADLISGTMWNNLSLYEMLLEQGELLGADGVDYIDLITEYAMYANNSSIGYTPVTEELAFALKQIVKKYGSETAASNVNQWLEVCVYYSAYGPNVEHVENPIIGLAPFTAIEFDENNEASAHFDRAIVPRGFMFKFVPEESGVYKFYTKGETATTGWVFNSNLDMIYEHNLELRQIFIDQSNGKIGNDFISYGYYEKGETYYIRAGFDDIYKFATITLAYEYVAEEYSIFTAVSGGAFTSSDDEMSDIIAGGKNVYLGEDGYYHVAGARGDDTYAYCDILYPTGIFSSASLMDFLELSLKEDTLAINKAFDFRYDENGNLLVNENNELLDEDGNVILNEDGTPMLNYYIDEDGNYIYDENGDKIEVFKDRTLEFKEYVEANMNQDETSELYGTVKVTKEFASLLQDLMDRYTFMGVVNSWTKLCYYFDYLAAVTE